MALPIRSRLLAAAVLAGSLATTQARALDQVPAAPTQIADEKMGKTIIVDEELKAGKKAEGGAQTAKQPAQKGGEGGEAGGGGGDGEEVFGVERPAPEGPDPNAPGSGAGGEGGANGANGGNGNRSGGE